MKRILPEEITDKLTSGQIEILAEMQDETPISSEWLLCAKQLTNEQFFQIYEMRGNIKIRKEQERKKSMTQGEKDEEKLKHEKWIKNLDPYGFYGNMGQPETIEEFKNRYGVYPPGYDENGANKLEY